MAVGIKITDTTEATALETVDLFDLSQKISTSPDVWESKKIVPEALRKKINAITSDTRANWLTAAGSNLLPAGQYIDILDRDVRLFCETTSKFSLRGSYTSRNPRYDPSGIYKGQWYTGIGSGSIDVGDILAYDGYHYQSRTGNEGTAPSGDAVNWLLLGTRLGANELLDRTTRTHASYVVEIYNCLYDISTDTLIEIRDIRGNVVGSQNVYQFQFGNNNKAYNTAIGSSLNCLNIVDGITYAFSACASSATGGNSSSFGGSCRSIGDNSFSKGVGAYSIGVGSEAGGKNSRSDLKYSRALAGGYFSARGDAQGFEVVAIKFTTDATPTELLIDGVGRLLIPEDSMWTFDMKITAAQHAGTSGTIGDGHCNIIQGGIKNIGGTVSFLPGGNRVACNDIGMGCISDLLADNTNKALSISVTGEVDKAIRWTVYISICQTGFRNYS